MAIIQWTYLEGLFGRGEIIWEVDRISVIKTGSVIQKLINGTEASTSEWSDNMTGNIQKELWYESKKDQVFAMLALCILLIQ